MLCTSAPAHAQLDAKCAAIDAIQERSLEADLRSEHTRLEKGLEKGSRPEWYTPAVAADLEALIDALREAVEKRDMALVRAVWSGAHGHERKPNAKCLLESLKESGERLGFLPNLDANPRALALELLEKASASMRRLLELPRNGAPFDCTEFLFTNSKKTQSGPRGAKPSYPQLSIKERMELTAARLLTPEEGTPSKLLVHALLSNQSAAAPSLSLPFSSLSTFLLRVLPSDPL